jgi:beta-N-acetylhexosaminidase
MRDLEALAGRVLMIGLPAASLDERAAARLRSLGPAGVILFRRNLDTPERLAELMRELRACLPGPALYALDQEGGRVSRLEPWTGATPSAAALARAGGTAVLRFGQATGTLLRGLGFNLDFAPVVDLSAPDATNGIGDRSYGTDAAAVVALGGAFLDGLQEQGVAGCLKHFPGLGDTAVDSHHTMPVCHRGLGELEAADLVPYRELGPRAASVMVGHAAYPSLEPDRGLPASLSRRVVQELLRRRLGYPGLVVSDDLEMGAVRPLDVAGAAAVAAVRAGCDLVLYASDLDGAEAARDALARTASTDRPFGERLRTAARDVGHAASRWPAPAPDPSGWRAGLRQLREACGAA